MVCKRKQSSIVGIIQTGTNQKDALRIVDSMAQWLVTDCFLRIRVCSPVAVNICFYLRQNIIWKNTVKVCS